MVVNCFQKFVSLPSWTVTEKNMSVKSMLWIAFKSLYLCHLEQSIIGVRKSESRCELLSKVCIFAILNSYQLIFLFVYLVVNCFQKFVSLPSWTVLLKKQSATNRCELLSKVCIFAILNSAFPLLTSTQFVVNCFQKFVSLPSWTVTFKKKRIRIVLWIAFKSLYLCHLEQCLNIRYSSPPSCELLSKVCIFAILNSYFIFAVH